MKKFMPAVYQKTIFDIDYDKLKKENNIKVLLFDFDNTIIEHGNNKINKKTKDLFKRLNKEFIIYVVSNSLNSKKLCKVCNELDIPYVLGSMKPLKRGYKKLKFKSVKNEEIAMIGDQLLTDIFGGNRMNYYSILVDPIKEKEIIFTKINRMFEKIIFNNKKNNIRRGKYYD